MVWLLFVVLAALVFWLKGVVLDIATTFGWVRHRYRRFHMTSLLTSLYERDPKRLQESLSALRGMKEIDPRVGGALLALLSGESKKDTSALPDSLALSLKARLIGGEKPPSSYPCPKTRLFSSLSR